MIYTDEKEVLPLFSAGCCQPYRGLRQGPQRQLPRALCVVFKSEEAFCDNKKTPQPVKHSKVLRDYSGGPDPDNQKT
jgi:hypothetical protein